jgi:hypothetical protein
MRDEKFRSALTRVLPVELEGRPTTEVILHSEFFNSYLEFHWTMISGLLSEVDCDPERIEDTVAKWIIESIIESIPYIRNGCKKNGLSDTEISDVEWICFSLMITDCLLELDLGVKLSFVHEVEGILTDINTGEVLTDQEVLGPVNG